MKYPNFIPVLVFSLLPLFSLAQANNPYQLNKEYDKDILIASASTYLVGLYLKETIRPLTDSELSEINIDKLNFLDRNSWNGNSKVARDQSDILLRVGLATPFFLAFDKEVKRDYLTNAVMFAEVILFNNAIADWTKALSRRARPYVYQSDIPIENKQGISAVHSYFSGHSSTVASYTFFTYHLTKQYSNKKWVKGSVLAFAIALPTYTSVLRVRAGKHFPTDVITGSLIGAFVGYGIPEWHLHKKKKSSQNGLSFRPSPNGIQLSYSWK